MKKSQAEWNRGEWRHGRLRREGSRRAMREAAEIQPTTAKNLEDKFDRGEEVLDYFELPKARVINPRSNGSVVKNKICVSGEAEFQTRNCRSRKISALSQKEVGSTGRLSAKIGQLAAEKIQRDVRVEQARH